MLLVILGSTITHTRDDANGNAITMIAVVYHNMARELYVLGVGHPWN